MNTNEELDEFDKYTKDLVSHDVDATKVRALVWIAFELHLINKHLSKLNNAHKVTVRGKG